MNTPDGTGLTTNFWVGACAAVSLRAASSAAPATPVVRNRRRSMLPSSAETRDHFLRAELERLLAAVAVEDALPEQQEDLAERDVARGVLDHPADGVGVADQQRRAVLAERHRPRVPHPETILGPRFGLALGVGEHEIAAPRRLFTARHVATVLLGHLAIAAPQHLAEAHLGCHHNGLAALLRPVERRLERMGEARVDRDRLLQRARGDAHLADRAVGV